jgi:hypothetical protein
VDTAAKIVRRYWALVGQPQRTVILSRRFAYHGTNAYGTSLSGIAAVRDGYGTLVGDVPEVAHDDPAELERVLDELGDRAAAFIGEPMIGAGGVIPPPSDYWPAVERICRERSVSDDQKSPLSRDYGGGGSRTRATFQPPPSGQGTSTLGESERRRYVPQRVSPRLKLSLLLAGDGDVEQEDGMKDVAPEALRDESRRVAFMNGAQGGSSRIMSTSSSAHALRRASPLSCPMRTTARL